MYPRGTFSFLLLFFSVFSFFLSVVHSFLFFFQCGSCDGGEGQTSSRNLDEISRDSIALPSSATAFADLRQNNANYPTHNANNSNYPTHNANHPTNNADYPTHNVSHTANNANHLVNNANHPTNHTNHPANNANHPINDAHHPINNANHSTQNAIDAQTRGITTVPFNNIDHLARDFSKSCNRLSSPSHGPSLSHGENENIMTQLTSNKARGKQGRSP